MIPQLKQSHRVPSSGPSRQNRTEKPAEQCFLRIAALRNTRLFMMRRSINLIISKEVLLLPNFLAATIGTPPPSRWSRSKPGASSRAGLFVFLRSQVRRRAARPFLRSALL